MAPPNVNFNELVSTTLRKRQKKFADNVLNHIAFLRYLLERGNVNLLDGGTQIIRELEYAENATYKRYSGYELLDVTPSEVFSAAEYEWMQAACVVSASGRELRINKGETRTINLLEKRMKNAEKTMKNNIAVDVYSAGSLANQMGGLQHLVADDPTAAATVGGIAQATETWWQNQTSTSVETNDATTIQGIMKGVWLNCVRGMDHPDLILADSIMYSSYEQSLITIQRITTPVKGQSGFSSLEFYGVGGSAPVMFDDAITTKHGYMLNTDYLFLDVHEDANFEPLPRRDAFNQDAIAVPVIFMGNVTCSNRSLQGVIFDGD